MITTDDLLSTLRGRISTSANPHAHLFIHVCEWNVAIATKRRGNKIVASIWWKKSLWWNVILSEVLRSAADIAVRTRADYGLGFIAHLATNPVFILFDLSRQKSAWIHRFNH
jgi:hypothetical protein